MLVFLGSILLLVLLEIGVGIVLFDVGRREEDAEWLQMKIVDGLHRDRVLSRLKIHPEVHLPSRRHGAMGIELFGEVPSEDTRGAVLDIVQETARKRGREIQIDDRLAVRRPAAAHVA